MRDVEASRLLRESGLSTRAIASATGLARNTVLGDLRGRDEVVQIEPPDDAEPAATAECIHCRNTLPLAQLYEGGQGYECDP